MKRYHSGLLVIHPLISTSCSSLKLKVKEPSPATGPKKHQQAIVSTIQVTLKNKPQSLLQFIKKYKAKLKALVGLLWLLARFYGAEKRRCIPRWQLEDPALLKIIKDNSARLWNIPRPDRKVVRLEERRG
jgi:hypothetical protein